MNQPVEPCLIIPVDMVQAIGNYLAQRPWGEVHEVLAALQGLRPYERQPMGEQVPEQAA